MERILLTVSSKVSPLETEDPLAVTRYGPLSTRDGTRRFEVAQAREAKGHLVATLEHEAIVAL